MRQILYWKTSGFHRVWPDDTQEQRPLPQPGDQISSPGASLKLRYAIFCVVLRSKALARNKYAVAGLG
jgi:hypothetical protein